MQAFIETHNVYVLEQLGLVFRNSLMGAIYRKTLRLNSEALNAASTGKIVTLMSNDAQKLQVCATAWLLHEIWHCLCSMWMWQLPCLSTTENCNGYATMLHT